MNQVKAGAILNYVIIGLNTITGLLYTPFMLRCLGQNEYGLYSLVASVIAYLTILDFGFGNAIIRYTAKFRAEGKHSAQWEMFGMFVVVYSIIGLIAFGAGLGLYFNVDLLFDRTMTAAELSQARVMMLLLTFNLAFTFPLSIFGAIITAYENFIFQRGVNIVRIILSTVVMIVLLSVGFKAIALVVVQTVFNLGVLVLNLWFCFRKLHIKVVFAKFNIPFLKEIVTYSFWIFLNAIMDKIYWGTGQFVLGSLVGTAAVAVFSVAILLQQMYMAFSLAISSVLLPRITAMVARRQSDAEISSLFIRTGRLQSYVVCCVLAGFIIFGQSFINLWAGAGYQHSYIITVIFFVALFVPMIQNTGIAILQARNQMKFRSLLYAAISLISLCFQVILAKRYGAIGCACAIGGSLVIGQGLIMNIYYHKRQGLNILRFWREHSPIIILTSVMICAGLAVSREISFSSPIVLISGILCFTVVYALLCRLFIMNSYERDLLDAPIHKILSRK